MKKILLSLFAFAGSVSATFAQDSLTASNMNPNLGEAFVSVTCDTTGVVPGSGGAAMVWDYTGLVSTGLDTGLAVMCAATPNCSMFPGTTIAIKSVTGTTVNYAIANSTKYAQNGYYYTASQYATFTDPLDQLHYPMHYLDSFADTYAGTITYTGVVPITAHENGIANVKYDGYGTLKLPGGVIYPNAVRVRSSQLFTDSASVFGIDTVASFVLSTYTWYTPGYHSPLFTILKSDQVGGGIHTKTVTYSKVAVLGVASINGLSSSLTLYPNPAYNELNIRFTLAKSEAIHITLTDLLGREVATIANDIQQSNVDIKYNTAQLPRGIYIVRLQTGSETVTHKVELL